MFMVDVTIVPRVLPSPPNQFPVTGSLPRAESLGSLPVLRHSIALLRCLSHSSSKPRCDLVYWL